MTRRWVVAALALVLLLTGCTNIPTAGDVKVGPTQDVKNQDVVLVPYKPAPGASQTDIVQGFITAATGQQGNYAVARQFLTPAFAKRWNPSARVLIHDESWQVKTVSDTAVTVTVPTTAEVDADGVYVSHAAAKDIAVPFRLTKVDGQWRIAATPDGIVLGTNYFGSLFTARPVSYFDPGWSQTVPDLRWFPARDLSPLRVVQALLAGPAAPIAPPVTATAFPPGTTVHSVRLSSSGLATVDLGMDSALPSLTVFRRMRAQLTDTLDALKGIQRVQIAVDGKTIPVAATAEPTNGPDARALVLRGGTVGFLSGQAFAPEPVLGRQIAAAQPTAGTVSVSQKLAALRTRDGVVLVTPAGRTVLDRRPTLAAPTLDDRGWVYSVPGGMPSAWKAFDAHGRSVTVTANVPNLLTITSIEASPDGTRMLVLGQTEAGYTAFVAGIVRAADGTPTALTTARYAVQVPASATGIGATWVDAPGSSVAVLTQDDTGDEVSIQQLGGMPTGAGRLTTADSIVGATGLKDLRALLQNGAIAQPSPGSGWQSTEPAGSADVLFVQR